MSYEREGTEIVIRLDAEMFDTLLLALGFAAGAAMNQNNAKFAVDFIALANEVNRGNPNFAPYDISSRPAGIR